MRRQTLSRIRSIHGFNRLTTLLGIALALTMLMVAAPGFAQDDSTPTPGDEISPAPANIGTGITATYQGPPPSGFQKELVGPVKLLRAAEVDLEAFTMTLPLYRGQMTDGTPVWYILTDTTDKANADALGLNHSAKLNYANVDGGARVATLENDLTLTFEGGTVDFLVAVLEGRERVSVFPQDVPSDAPTFVRA